LQKEIEAEVAENAQYWGHDAQTMRWECEFQELLDSLFTPAEINEIFWEREFLQGPPKPPMKYRTLA
jgi:hypothetical protein